MATWWELASDSRKAANRLIQDQHHRSAVSRAYYAVYSKVAHELTERGITMPKDREGPSHAKVRALIETRLTALPLAKRQALSRMVGSLYTMRILADYKPTTSVDPRDSREAASLMKKCFESF
jgi:uncharacterized protein (UPF0332 family)